MSTTDKFFHHVAALWAPALATQNQLDTMQADIVATWVRVDLHRAKVALRAADKALAEAVAT